MKVEIGNKYDRRDGLVAFVFNYDTISQQYRCVILGTDTFFSVYEDGKYLRTQPSHNDLVEEL